MDLKSSCIVLGKAIPVSALGYSQLYNPEPFPAVLRIKPRASGPEREYSSRYSTCLAPYNPGLDSRLPIWSYQVWSRRKKKEENPGLLCADHAVEVYLTRAIVQRTGRLLCRRLMQVLLSTKGCGPKTKINYSL